MTTLQVVAETVMPLHKKIVEASALAAGIACVSAGVHSQISPHSKKLLKMFEVNMTTTVAEVRLPHPINFNHYWLAVNPENNERLRVIGAHRDQSVCTWVLLAKAHVAKLAAEKNARAARLDGDRDKAAVHTSFAESMGAFRDSFPPDQSEWQVQMELAKQAKHGGGGGGAKALKRKADDAENPAKKKK